MDPIQMGLMSLFGSQNPEQFAQLMSTMGIKPEELMAATGSGAGDPLGAAIGGAPASFAAPTLPAPAMPGATPAVIGGAGAAPAANPSSALLSGLQGVKAPVTSPPIMTGGSGGPKTPDVNVGAHGGGSVLANAIMSLIAGGGSQPNPLRVPALGSLLGGR